MKFSVFFLAILLFASCATSRYSEAEIERFKKIEDPAERWRAHNIHNYNYQIRLGCFCSVGGGYRVSVRHDKVEKVEKTHDPRGALRKEPKDMGEDFLKNFHTFDGYYDWFKTIGPENENYVEIEQDSIYGYPKKFIIRSAEDSDYKITDVEFLD